MSDNTAFIQHQPIYIFHQMMSQNLTNENFVSVVFYKLAERAAYGRKNQLIILEGKCTAVLSQKEIPFSLECKTYFFFQFHAGKKWGASCIQAGITFAPYVFFVFSYLQI